MDTATRSEISLGGVSTASPPFPPSLPPSLPPQGGRCLHFPSHGRSPRPSQPGPCGAQRGLRRPGHRGRGGGREGGKEGGREGGREGTCLKGRKCGGKGDGRRRGTCVSRPSVFDEALACQPTSLPPSLPPSLLSPSLPCLQIHQSWSPWASLTSRLYRDARVLEVEWELGPVPVDDGVGKEVVLRLGSDLRSEGTLWTDANGREFQERKLCVLPAFPCASFFWGLFIMFS
jgi:hypothetical protein